MATHLLKLFSWHSSPNQQFYAKLQQIKLGRNTPNCFPVTTGAQKWKTDLKLAPVPEPWPVNCSGSLHPISSQSSDAVFQSKSLRGCSLAQLFNQRSLVFSLLLFHLRPLLFSIFLLLLSQLSLCFTSSPFCSQQSLAWDSGADQFPLLFHFTFRHTLSSFSFSFSGSKNAVLVSRKHCPWPPRTSAVHHRVQKPNSARSLKLRHQHPTLDASQLCLQVRWRQQRAVTLSTCTHTCNRSAHNAETLPAGLCFSCLPANVTTKGSPHPHPHAYWPISRGGGGGRHSPALSLSYGHCIIPVKSAALSSHCPCHTSREREREGGR